MQVDRAGTVSSFSHTFQHILSDFYLNELIFYPTRNTGIVIN